MCNLYSLTKGQKAIIEIARAMRDGTGNLPPLPGIFPDQDAPVVRNTPEGRELAMMRWGFPPPPQGNRPVTNVRNTGSPFWRAWLGAEHRCLVPATSFCEYADTRPRKTPVWFARDDSRPLFFFAGIWRSWRGLRKAAEGVREHRLFGFLTCPANRDVAPVHPQAMPVILTTPEEIDRWLEAPVEAALTLQRPLAEGMLRIVAEGPREDPAGAD